MNYLKNFSQAEYQLKEKRQLGVSVRADSDRKCEEHHNQDRIRSSEKGGVNATDIVECPEEGASQPGCP